MVVVGYAGIQVFRYSGIQRLPASRSFGLSNIQNINRPTIESIPPAAMTAPNPYNCATHPPATGPIIVAILTIEFTSPMDVALSVLRTIISWVSPTYINAVSYTHLRAHE